MMKNAVWIILITLTQISAEKWLLRYFTKEEQEFLDCDAGLLIRIARLLHKVPKGEMTYAMYRFLYYKYTALELDKPFMEQFRENNRKLIAALEKSCAGIKRRLE